MICTTCHGERWVWIDISNGGRVRQPCPDCLGGEMHCCEGLVAQPEAQCSSFCHPNESCSIVEKGKPCPYGRDARSGS